MSKKRGFSCPDSVSVDQWLEGQNYDNWKSDFDKNGFLVIKDILNNEEVIPYRELYDEFLSGNIDAYEHRHDLGSHVQQKVGAHTSHRLIPTINILVDCNISHRQVEKEENVCQIMWPSLYVEDLLCGPFYQRALKCARIILGDDLEFDFDMMISKAPFTDTVVPWHQDESYWPDLPDKRAVTFWLSLDQATVDNGCMQFIPGSHKQPLRPSGPAVKGHHALQCEATEDEFVAAPLSPGSCTLHQGRTVHYTKGNKTASRRRALIMNARPGSMIRLEREQGFDHAKKGIKTVLETGQSHEAVK